MSRLLLDEKPLLVMPKLAAKIGLNESIVLQQIHYWIKGKEEDRRNGQEYFFDEHYWVYNSIQAWQEQFPFWSIKTIQRTFTSLLDKGLLLKGNYNKDKYDRTLWYTIDYDKLDSIEKGENALGQNDQMRIGQNDQMPLGQNDQMDKDKMTEPIPENTTETTTEKTAESRPDLPNSKNELIEYYIKHIGGQSKEILWIIEYWLCKFDNFETFAGVFLDTVDTAVSLNEKNADYIHKQLLGIYTYWKQNKKGERK